MLTMADNPVKGLNKEITVATATEKDAQADYETLMMGSAEKLAQDSSAEVKGPYQGPHRAAVRRGGEAEVTEKAFCDKVMDRTLKSIELKDREGTKTKKESDVALTLMT